MFITLYADLTYIYSRSYFLERITIGFTKFIIRIHRLIFTIFSHINLPINSGNERINECSFLFQIISNFIAIQVRLSFC